MKVRNGFVSNSSSSSFIISGSKKPRDVFEYAKKQTLQAIIEHTLNDVEFVLKGGCEKYGKKPESIEERVAEVDLMLNRLIKDYNYYLKTVNKDIKISTVREMKRSVNNNSDFNIEEWYEGSMDKFADNDIVLYDTYDNFIPYRACDKIIKKYKPIDYNTHMG